MTNMIHDFDFTAGDIVYFEYHNDVDSFAARQAVMVVGEVYFNNEKWYLCETDSDCIDILEITPIEQMSTDERVVFMVCPDELSPYTKDVRLIEQN
jgi:hypothetical protein